MSESIKTYAGSNYPVKDCFLTLEVLISDIDTADTDEPYDVDGAVTSLNIIIDTLEREEKELTNYKLGFATQTEERERLEAENERLREVIGEYIAYCVPLDRTTGDPILKKIRQRMGEVLK